MDLRGIIKQLNEKNIKHCFNEQFYDKNKLEFIIVGDNPGKIEYEKKRYFVGSSGRSLRSFFQNNIINKKGFDDLCCVFNKTFIHTSKTNELINFKSENESLFNNTLIYCAEEISELSNFKNLPVLIFGKTHLKPKSIFEPFWRKINESIEKKENILVYNHPSYNNFNKEWEKYKKQYSTFTNKELLMKIGTDNTQAINNHYLK